MCMLPGVMAVHVVAVDVGVQERLSHVDDIGNEDSATANTRDEQFARCSESPPCEGFQDRETKSMGSALGAAVTAVLFVVVHRASWYQFTVERPLVIHAIPKMNSCSLYRKKIYATHLSVMSGASSLSSPCAPQREVPCVLLFSPAFHV